MYDYRIFGVKAFGLGSWAIEPRAISQGWSLQSYDSVAGTTDCGQDSYCPSSLKCNVRATAEVATCCTSSGCRGDIEGNPQCADSSWSLWKGYNGNGFCCLVGLKGVYVDSTSAGFCVDTTNSVASFTSATIVTVGSETAVTSVATSATTAFSATSSKSPDAISTTSSPTSRLVAASLPTLEGMSSASEPSGLSTGAKAGIGVGIPALSILILLAILLYLRRRKNARRNIIAPDRDAENQGPFELSPDLDVREMEAAQEKPPNVSFVPEVEPEKKELESIQRRATELSSDGEKHELGIAESGIHAKASEADMIQNHDTKRELASDSPIRPESIPQSPDTQAQASQSPIVSELSASPFKNYQSLHEPAGEQTTSVPPTIETPSTAPAPSAEEIEAEEAELQALQAHLERVRGEKERLAKMQKLDELEEELKAQIVAKQRRVMGS